MPASTHGLGPAGGSACRGECLLPSHQIRAVETFLLSPETALYILTVPHFKEHRTFCLIRRMLHLGCWAFLSRSRGSAVFDLLLGGSRGHCHAVVGGMGSGKPRSRVTGALVTVVVRVHLMWQPDWIQAHPDIWLNTILGVSVQAFLEEISISIGRQSRTPGPYH